MQYTILENGVRLVSEEVPGMPSVTVGIWVENGSRDEAPEENGIAHFLEHLFFKGRNGGRPQLLRKRSTLLAVSSMRLHQKNIPAITQRCSLSIFRSRLIY